MPRYYKLAIKGEVPEGAETSSVRSLFTGGAAEDVEGHVPAILPTQATTEAGDRMATFRLHPPKEEGAASDLPAFHLEPVSADEAESTLLRSHVLHIDSGDAGKLVGRFVPVDTAGQPDAKDAEGHIARRDASEPAADEPGEDDTEGHKHRH